MPITIRNHTANDLPHQSNFASFAPLFLAPATNAEADSEPHHIWTIVVADPTRVDGDTTRLPCPSTKPRDTQS